MDDDEEDEEPAGGEGGGGGGGSKPGKSIAVTVLVVVIAVRNKMASAVIRTALDLCQQTVDILVLIVLLVDLASRSR